MKAKVILLIFAREFSYIRRLKQHPYCMNKILKKNIKALRDLCLNHSVEKLYVFGSAGTDDFNKNSDIDFLVSFGRDIPLLEFANNFFEFHQSLEHTLGRKVDLISEKSIQNPYLARSINSSREKVYDREGEKISF